jgi:hypothetical protein
MRKIMFFLVGMALVVVLVGFSYSYKVMADNIGEINKIVIFRFDSPSGPVSLWTTQRVSSYLERRKEVEVETWYGDRSSSYNYKRTSPEKMDEICKKFNADVMLIGTANEEIGYGPQTLKGKKREELLNIKLELKLIATDTKKVLWSGVQNSRDFITDHALSLENYEVHINAASKSIANNLTNALGFGSVKECQVESTGSFQDKTWVVIDGEKYYYNDVVCGGKIVSISSGLVTLKFADEERSYKLGEFVDNKN